MLHTLSGSSTIAISGGAGRKVIYASRDILAPEPRHSYDLGFTNWTGTFQDHEFPLCTFQWNGAQIVIDGSNPVLDKRVWGTIGYWHTQRNKNEAGNNNLPQPLVCMWGSIDVLADSYSDPIYLTHDWGTDTATGGGTAPGSGGKQVFATKPLIKVFVEGPAAIAPPWPTPLPCAATYFSDFFDGPYNDSTGYSVVCFDETQFRIINAWGTGETFYWIAIGPAFTNLAATIEGKGNPSYDEAV